MRPDRGFTLIEVMVALAIFVAAALALDAAMSANVRGTVRFEEKTLATWVASNKLVELQLYQQWPATGRQDDEAELGGRRWFVQVDVSNGPLPATRRVDITVGPATEFGEERQSVASLAALLAQPPPPPQQPAAAPGGP